MLNIAKIKPGLLVSVKTRQHGGVSYTKRDIEAPRVTESGAQVSRWETDKFVYDPDETERAQQVANRARYLVTRHCVKTEMQQLLCPNDRRGELKDAIVEARALVSEFNQGASFTEIQIDVWVGEIVDNGVDAAQQIFASQQSFLNEMIDGLKEMDPKKVRAAINKSRDLGQMMSAQANEMVREATRVAEAARQRIITAGEKAIVALDVEAIAKIGSVRNSFLDFDYAASEPVVEFSSISAPIRRPDLGEAV
jgi:vacuolar-type H+-ATPase subunit H